MLNLAVNVAVIHERKILLTKRDDFHVWCLPSSGVEAGESLAEAAIRETKEETGIDVELTRLVGVYSRLGVVGLPDGHAVLYEGRPIGGELTLQPGETIDVRYFALDEIPNEMAFAHKQRIADAMNGVQGVSVRQQIKLLERPACSRKELLERMQESGLSPEEFYMQRIKDAEINEIVEVGHL